MRRGELDDSDTMVVTRLNRPLAHSTRDLLNTLACA
jgi:hypothetical protein